MDRSGVGGTVPRLRPLRILKMSLKMTFLGFVVLLGKLKNVVLLPLLHILPKSTTRFAEDYCSIQNEGHGPVGNAVRHGIVIFDEN